MNAKVSIILTTYNRKKYLRQAIGSVLAQTFNDWELIVVDDLSTDGTESLIWVWSASAWINPRGDEKASIHLFKTDLPGHGEEKTYVNRFAHNINLAFGHCRGSYITYLCDDDLYLPWRLEGFCYILDKNPQVHVVYGQQQLMTEAESHTRLTGVRETVGTTMAAAQRVDHSSVMHRRECFEKVGGWDESAPMRYGDAFFWQRLNDAGYAFHPIKVPMDCHRYHNESVTYKIDHPEEEKYPPFDDMGNKRLVNSGVDPMFSAIDK